MMVCGLYEEEVCHHGFIPETCPECSDDYDDDEDDFED
jgi:hypothetical protein